MPTQSLNSTSTTTLTGPDDPATPAGQKIGALLLDKCLVVGEADSRVAVGDLIQIDSHQDSTCIGYDYRIGCEVRVPWLSFFLLQFGHNCRCPSTMCYCITQR
jgi:hypothetical protein